IASFTLMDIVPAGATVISFEGLSDGTILTNQFAGLNFTNTSILSAGISLNELDFPPHSSVNVASDLGGAITITFVAPQQSVGGYFTYAGSSPLTLNAYDSASNLLGTVVSNFTRNFVSSGNPPNEFLSLSASGISSVTIGGPNTDFTLDDLTFE